MFLSSYFPFIASVIGYQKVKIEEIPANIIYLGYKYLDTCFKYELA